MRVAFLAGQLSRQGSGVRQVIEGLSGGIARQGNEVKVFGISDATWATDATHWKGAPAEVFECYGPSNFGFTPALGKALMNFAPDLLHLHGIWMYSSAIAATWAERTKRPLVISPHGMLAPAALSYSKRRKRVVRALYQDRCFANAAGYHATSAAEARDIRTFCGDVSVAVVPNGVEDTSVTLPDLATRAHKVIAIGRLHPVKGYDRLLQAWAQVEAHFPGWQLEIAGPDPDGYGKFLRKLIEDLKLQRASIGTAKYGEARDLAIADARLFALPSLTENFALTVPEALLCATPVLASTGAPWAELPQRGCGWWVDPTPDALAEALHAALSLPEKQLAQMGKSGRDWARSAFGWDHIAQDMVGFYASVRGPT
ncbi:glycosyltransferase involved in cell wall bisynthesis [Rhodobacter sp. JA431]|uniref:glycosyltransferase n=1 Tax=Rhodobacter sp. JA431 TaxID=570013 RepID=UPI000BD4ED96|nr:glycosyltransferase [Rhodobacter sp. JA431]SOB99930.1 glycosyltransferase involved in cell wall bisynthesis [Rhodobacter sp. JA431]